MKYEDVKVDERYLVDYIDPNYPCKCQCHDFPDMVRHVAPCCHDNSFRGMATCVKKNDSTQLIEFLIDKKVGGGWYLAIFAEDIVDTTKK